VHRSIGQIKHQFDATLCGFYFCRVTLHGSGVKRPSSGVLKNILRTSFVPNMVMWWHTCNYNTCTRGRRASFLVLLMMGAWRPKHVEWLCRNKTCTVLHQVGVSFHLYYEARKHKIKIYIKVNWQLHAPTVLTYFKDNTPKFSLYPTRTGPPEPV
jgi:hypothetical protein